MINVGLPTCQNKMIIKLIRLTQKHFNQRVYKSFAIGLSWIMKTSISMAKPIISDNQWRTIRSYRERNPAELIELCHPSQLEEKYGGEAKNLTKCWPPKEISTEYGIDPFKLITEDETINVSDVEINYFNS
jgi:hypothetical protein